MQWPIHNFKFHLFPPEVVSVAEANVKLDSAQGVVGTSRDDFVEIIICGLQELGGDIHFSQISCIN
jgi:hypothetical protein